VNTQRMNDEIVSNAVQTNKMPNTRVNMPTPMEPVSEHCCNRYGSAKIKVQYATNEMMHSMKQAGIINTAFLILCRTGKMGLSLDSTLSIMLLPFPEVSAWLIIATR